MVAILARGASESCSSTGLDHAPSSTAGPELQPAGGRIGGCGRSRGSRGPAATSRRGP